MPPEYQCLMPGGLEADTAAHVESPSIALLCVLQHGFLNAQKVGLAGDKLKQKKKKGGGLVFKYTV